MSTLLTSIGDLEKELSLLEDILYNILIYEVSSSELVVNLRFTKFDEYESSIIGGLANTLNEFGGKVEKGKIRSIVLEDIKLLFTSLENFILLLVVDPTYDNSQFTNLLLTLTEVLDLSFTQFRDMDSLSDEIVINSELILSLIAEDIGIQMEMGPNPTIYPFKLRELAEARTLKLLGKPKLDTVIEVPPEEIIEEVVEEQPPEIHVAKEALSAAAPPTQKNDILDEKNEALYHLLNKFVQTFNDALQITLVRFKADGTINKITAGRLEKDIEENLYNTVLSMMTNIFNLLDKEEKYRTIDLGENYIYFQYVDDSSFIYTTVKNQEVMALIMPLIERISNTIANLFPSVN